MSDTHTNDHAQSMCTYCPKLCRHTCPVSTAEPRETLIPQAKVALLRRQRLGETERTAEQSASLYGCTGCGACTEFCRHDVEVAPILFSGRAEAVQAGNASPALRGLEQLVIERSHAAARALRDSVPAERRPGEAQVAFMPGCHSTELGEKMLAVADRLGADYLGVVDGEHSCGGYELYAAGENDAFRRFAQRVAQQLRGYARVVVHCPQCAYTMKHQYGAFGVALEPQIEHTTEFLEAFSERLPITSVQPDAYYHDPCYLGRHLGVVEAPRRLLRRSINNVHEFSRSGRESECSGGGGLLPRTMPSTATAIAHRRRSELPEAGPRRIVTACAQCKHQLKAPSVEVTDIIDELYRATQPAAPPEDK